MRACIVAALVLLPLAGRAELVNVPLFELVADSDLIMTATLTNVQKQAQGDMIACRGMLVPGKILHGGYTETPVWLVWSIAGPNIVIKEDPIDYSPIKNQPRLWLLKQNPDGTYGAGHYKRVQLLDKVAEVAELVGQHVNSTRDRVGQPKTASAAGPSLSGLPMPEDVFTIAVAPHADGTPGYFTPESLLDILPRLQPADVQLPVLAVAGKVGTPRWQNGVIVLKDKQVLFWRSCGDWFIAIECTNGLSYYAANKEPSQTDDTRYEELYEGYRGLVLKTLRALDEKRPLDTTTKDYFAGKGAQVLLVTVSRKEEAGEWKALLHTMDPASPAKYPNIHWKEPSAVHVYRGDDFVLMESGKTAPGEYKDDLHIRLVVRKLPAAGKPPAGSETEAARIIATARYLAAGDAVAAKVIAEYPAILDKHPSFGRARENGQDYFRVEFVEDNPRGASQHLIVNVNEDMTLRGVEEDKRGH